MQKILIMKLFFYIILIFIFSNNLLYAQIFEFRGNDMFGLQEYVNDSTQRAIKLMFNDIDFDGDQDLIVAGIDEIKYDSTGNLNNFSQIKYFVSVQENIGTRWHPDFSPRKSFMDHFPFQNGYFFPAIGDLNNDKKLDFFVASGVDSFLNLIPLYYQRKAITGDDQFNIIPCTDFDVQAIVAGSFFLPDLADMDKDGDLDILMSGFVPGFDSLDANRQPVFLFAKNTGTKSTPQFLGWYHNPYGLANTIDQIQMATVGDIDNDDDNDIISLTTFDTFTVLNYYENTPLTNGKADFTSFSTLLGLPMANTEEAILPPALVDIDGDGDLDLFMVQDLLDKGTGIGYYENKLCTTTLDNTVTKNNTVLTANAQGVSYQWIDCSTFSPIEGETNRTIIPNKTGKYAVMIKDNNGCENTSACIEVIISSVNDIYGQYISINPNPAFDYFSIENRTNDEIEKINILNMNGEIVKSITEFSTEKIFVGDLHGGNYICELWSEKWKVTKTLSVVNK